MQGFNVGSAETLITPQAGCELAGFAARNGVCTGVHDDLYATALVLTAHGKTVALVSLDVIAVTQAFTRSVREAISASRGIPPENVFVFATHTHCGPVTLNHFFNPGQGVNDEFLASARQGAVAVLEKAFDERREAVVRAGMVSVVDVAVNRRNQNGKPVDEQAGVMIVEDLDGSVTAALVNYACHPTVLGADTLQFTRDFPHYLERALHKHLGGKVTVLFLNGALGDLNIGHKSALTAVGGSSPSRTFEKAQEIGESLARQVISGISSLELEHAEVVCEHATVRLPLKPYAPAETMHNSVSAAEQNLKRTEEAQAPNQEPSSAVLQSRCDVLFARIEEFFACSHAQHKLTALEIEVAAVKIGNTGLVVLPGEPFVEIGLRIRQDSPLPRTFVAGLANDYIGYIPTAEEAELGGYEVVASQVLPEAAVLIQNSAHELLQRIHDTHTEAAR